jgi:pimeloyl-ACP methyl ester carboxylesterase
MQPDFIAYKSSRIHYSQGGNGDKVLVCLHGYGESEQSFHFLEGHLPAGYRLVAIDLPYHGKTAWNEPVPITIADIIAILDDICSKNALASPSFQLLAFSMGGRVALHLTQEIPARITKMTLLAPDGMTVNFWYWLATQTYIGRSIFRFNMHYPQWFILMLNTGKWLGIVNLSIHKFIRYYIHDKAVRQQLFDRWTCMRKIKPDHTLLKKNIRAYQLPVQLVYGEYDRIIRHERGEKFRHGIESFCTLQVIPSGHQLLQEKYAALVIQLIQS